MTQSGFRMVTLVSLVHFAKALTPMLVTPSGMVTLVRLEQLAKGATQIVVNVSGRSIVFKCSL